ncbi:MAG: helix-turn-helix domain-containing protein [Agromyces sp.]
MTLDTWGGDSMESVGKRLKSHRLSNGMSLREMAREAGVSASFLSQIENGKSQPSVATLFSLAQILNVRIDDLFDASDEQSTPPVPIHPIDGDFYDGDGLDPARIWSPSEYANRISVIHPSHRAKIAVSEGVEWARLASTPEDSCNFMKIVYQPGAQSTEQGERVEHPGYEYGYVLSGELEVTVGGEVFILHPGESIGFDCSIPHIFRNNGTEPAEAVWFIHGAHTR